jgi:cytochrome c biogenesis protein CcmG, thiol:disulfide interchange protein DsbE
MARQTKLAIGVVLAIAIVGLAVWGLASGGDEGDPGAGNPESKATDYGQALADAPPALAALYANGDEIVEGGVAEFERQLAALEGYPIVVNKWASWCGPCRLEFPYFQAVAADRGDEIAFLGINFNDSVDAAETFLGELPLPYPSIRDPDDEIAELIKGYYAPSTAFYDERGELVYTRQGPYESEQDLADEIDKYLG